MEYMTSESGQEALTLGARLGGLGTVLIGFAGGELARALARCAGCGAALAGGEVRFHDGSCAACGVWLGRYYGLPATLFFRQEGERVQVYALNGEGQTLSVMPPACAAPSRETGSWDLLAGADGAWASHRVSGCRLRGAVSAQGPAALTLALERLGYEVLDRPVANTPRFVSDREGFILTVEDNGRVFHPKGEDALEAAVLFSSAPQAIPAFSAWEGGPA